jgi:hypothetical protein
MKELLNFCATLVYTFTQSNVFGYDFSNSKVEKSISESRVEAVSNISTVTLWVIGDDKNGTQYLGEYTGHPVPGGYKYRDLALQVGGFSNLRQ